MIGRYIDSHNLSRGNVRPRTNVYWAHNKRIHTYHRSASHYRGWLLYAIPQYCGIAIRMSYSSEERHRVFDKDSIGNKSTNNATGTYPHICVYFGAIQNP